MLKCPFRKCLRYHKTFFNWSEWLQ